MGRRLMNALNSYHGIPIKIFRKLGEYRLDNPLERVFD
jgi:hypothetical protein